MQSDSNVEDYVQQNKRHWNAIAKRDWPKRAEMLTQIRDGAPYLDNMEPKIAPYLRNIQGKRIIVLQFGDAFVLLACAKKGASVTGVDLSSEQVKFARQAAAYCGVDVKLIEADCQNLPEGVPEQYFDFAVAECGIFIWIKNIEAWMRNAHRVLRKGGRLVVSDFHPLSIIAEEKEDEVTFTKSYFNQHPEACEPKENLPSSVEYLWKLSDIINAAIGAGFQIERVEEYYVEQKVGEIPLLPTDFLLIARK